MMKNVFNNAIIGRLIKLLCIQGRILEISCLASRV